jgi:hypothetical protein
MPEPDWKWYVGYSDKIYESGPIDTREEAIRIAREEFEGGYIIEAYKGDVQLSDYFDTDWFIEDANERTHVFQGLGGDPLFDPSIDQQRDLQLMVRETIKEWSQKHELTFTPWCFTHQRNEEYIDGK